MNMNQWAEILNNQIEFPYMYKLNIESPSGPKKKEYRSISLLKGACN